MNYKLTPPQEKYLSEIENMVVSPITKGNPRYPIAKELEKMGLLKLTKSNSPLIGIVLTDSGKECLADRYEIWDYTRPDELIKGAYTISESDEKKGSRLTIVDKDTGEIIWERK